MAISQTSPLPLAVASPTRRAVNVRSLMCGLIGVLLLSILAPFNDLVLNNSAMIGGALPVSAVFLFCALIVFINGPLSRFFPHLALTTPELAIVFAMMLVSCALPTRGLMQMWPATTVGVAQHAGTNPDYKEAFKLLQLPGWFWPSTIDERSPTDPLVAWFYGQIPIGASAADQTAVIKGWIAPVLGWGVFFVGIGTAIIGLSTIAARQWIQNERVAFPISTVQLALIEAPPRGRWLNHTLSSKSFLVGAGIMLVFRLINGLHVYFPKYVPPIGLAYNLKTMFVEPPFSYIDAWITTQTIYPLVAAMTFFIASRISFSLWVCVVLSQIPNLIMEPMATSMGPHRSEVNLGALLAFAAMILYSGRQYYFATLKTLIGRVRPVVEGAARPSRSAAIASVLGFVIAVGWLVVVKMPLWPAVLLVGGLLLIWLVMANVVAQSGLLVANTLATPHEWFSRGFTNAGGLASVNVGHVRTQFFAQVIGGMWAYNSDHLSVYTTHAIKTTDEAAPRSGKLLFVALALALVIGFVASLSSTLWCEYHYSITADSTQTTPINAEVMNGQPKWGMDHTVRTMRTGLEKAGQKTSAWPWVLGSAGITGSAAYLQLHFSNWPLHPIGLLMMYSYPMRRIWFSVFLGWLLKTTLVKFGGATIYRRAEPFFIGIVVGEAVAAAVFAVLALILWAMGIEFQVIPSLPTSQF